MEEQNFWIPRTLDAPNMFFLWESDMAMLFITIFILGGVLDMALVGVLVAYFTVKGYARLKEDGGRGLLAKVMYWYLPGLGENRFPSHIREYLG